MGAQLLGAVCKLALLAVAAGADLDPVLAHLGLVLGHVDAELGLGLAGRETLDGSFANLFGVVGLLPTASLLLGLLRNVRVKILGNEWLGCRLEASRGNLELWGGQVEACTGVWSEGGRGVEWRRCLVDHVLFRQGRGVYPAE